MISACGCHSAATTATQILKDEHRIIEKVLNATEAMLLRDSIDKRFFEQALDFLRNFADGCHHAKEEDELFPILQSAGIPREGGPIGCMVHEHEQGRALLGRLAASLDAAAQGDRRAEESVRRATTDYIALLRQHIFKEDNVLFAMADDVLGAEEQQLMIRAFNRGEKSNGCAGKHERYLALADELAKQSVGRVQ